VLISVDFGQAALEGYLIETPLLVKIKQPGHMPLDCFIISRNYHIVAIILSLMLWIFQRS
jgi:hypothetical protein